MSDTLNVQAPMGTLGSPMPLDHPSSPAPLPRSSGRRRGFSSRLPAWLFGACVSSGNPGSRAVALTFDDGPCEGTLPLLDVLAAEGVTATFFQCGMNVERHPAIARKVALAGHEIGNHTYSHARLCPRLSRRPNFLSPAAIYRELADAQEILCAETGTIPVLFRPPYGFRWIGVGSAQRRLHLLGVLWTVIGHDWEWPAERIAERVFAGTGPGGILCLHDGRDIRPNPDISQTIAAVRRIIPVLKNEGYSFATVSDLLRTEPFPPFSQQRSWDS
jgi:peptidoglycan-N-acetylglucosamine deacetylase